MSNDYIDIHEEEVGEKPFDARLMLRLLGYLKPYTKWVALAFGLILITSVTRQAGPFLTKIAVDDYILVGDYEGLHQIVLIYVGLLVLQLLGNFFQSYVTQMTGQWAMVDVRHHIFSHLQRLPLKYFDRTPIGRLMTRNTNDVDALAELHRHRHLHGDDGSGTGSGHLRRVAFHVHHYVLVPGPDAGRFSSFAHTFSPV